MKLILLALAFVLPTAALAQSDTAEYLTRAYHVQTSKADRVATVLDRLCAKYSAAERREDWKATDRAGDLASDLLSRETIDAQFDEFCDL